MREINDVKEFDEFIDSNKVTAVYFTAGWCGPCKFIGPEFEKLAKEYPDYTCVKLDVDKMADIAQRYSITALPTFIFFSNGEKLGDLSGANTASLKQIFQKFKDST
ncbi:thioredoxin-like protein [Syncephalastrum racemosum]|uniref:Thioredoxin n=1 Tax=Syncephalastrum racemosum TaxID=13706 RepID=A0A1X2H8Z4_SYNRA|nr:thioredoxin-like protein [Syncephalastrum racemosum]